MLRLLGVPAPAKWYNAPVRLPVEARSLGNSLFTTQTTAWSAFGTALAGVPPGQIMALAHSEYGLPPRNGESALLESSTTPCGAEITTCWPKTPDVLEVAIEPASFTSETSPPRFSTLP